jgi:hypothetical protein
MDREERVERGRARSCSGQPNRKGSGFQGAPAIRQASQRSWSPHSPIRPSPLLLLRRWGHRKLDASIKLASAGPHASPSSSSLSLSSSSSSLLSSAAPAAAPLPLAPAGSVRCRLEAGSLRSAASAGSVGKEGRRRSSCFGRSYCVHHARRRPSTGQHRLSSGSRPLRSKIAAGPKHPPRPRP